jgi:hypothetical protein
MKNYTYYKIIIILLVCILLFILYKLFIVNTNLTNQDSVNTTTSSQNKQIPSFIQYANGNIWPPDILNNKYAAPLKDNRYTPALPNIPINIPTNIGYVTTAYRQLGILSPMHTLSTSSSSSYSKNELLILMGRPLYVNRNKWQYYAISDQRNGIKLPISIQGRDALNEYGVNELYNQDIVYVKGYNSKYRIDMYEQDNNPQYIPVV